MRKRFTVTARVEGGGGERGKDTRSAGNPVAFR
jgi:hypothetical protein